MTETSVGRHSCKTKTSKTIAPTLQSPLPPSPLSRNSALGSAWPTTPVSFRLVHDALAHTASTRSSRTAQASARQLPMGPKLGAELDDLSALFARPGFGYSCVTQYLVGCLYTADAKQPTREEKGGAGQRGNGRARRLRSIVCRERRAARPGRRRMANHTNRSTPAHCAPGLSRSVDLTCLSNGDCDAG